MRNPETMKTLTRLLSDAATEAVDAWRAYLRPGKGHFEHQQAEIALGDAMEALRQAEEREEWLHVGI